MKFSELAVYFDKLEGISSRNEMTEVLAELLKKSGEDEIGVVINISLGQLRPKFDKLEFNVAERMILKTIGLAFGIEEAEVKKQYKELGDVGDLVFKIKATSDKLQATSLNVLDVYQRLEEIAEDSGEGSQERKVNGLVELLKELDGVSGKYVVRMVVGKLRLGFSDMTILDALSWMETGDKRKRKSLENGFQLYPDIAKIGQMAKEFGADKVEEKINVEIGVPVIPALAQRLKTADEMLKKMGEKVAVEGKYDGTRVQIHYRRHKGTKAQKHKSDDWEVRTFTRNLDVTTHMFPELKDMAEFVKADELILDCEAMGYDKKTGALKTFQETIQRKRKHGVSEKAEEIPLKFFVFDVLFKDGESLVKKPFYERRKMLEESVVNGDLFELSEMLETGSADEVRAFHAEQLVAGLEGAMVKKWDGVYNPGRKGWTWVKFKEAEDSAAKLSDTVDAVVMGLYSGKGKRTAFGVGAFLIGIRADEVTIKEQKRKGTKVQKPFEEGMVYSISKVGTGLSDEQWRELKARSAKYEIRNRPKEYAEVDKNLVPDVWLDSGLIVEIAADEVTKSPLHSAGWALRFPRLVKFRDDKDVEQVTSIGELEKMV